MDKGENKMNVKRIKGLEILDYIPDILLKKITMSVAELGLEWNEPIIRECNLNLTPKKYCHITYKYNDISMTGEKYLFGFNTEPKEGHLFWYSKPWLHFNE